MCDQVFLCSSQAPADEPWRQRLRVMLQPLVQQGALRLWDRTSVPAGARWEDEIERALARARVALVLVSADLLAADDLAERELPVLLRAAEAGTLRLLWVPVRASLHEWSQFAPYQPVHPPERPLAELSEAEQDQALVKIVMGRPIGSRPGHPARSVAREHASSAGMLGGVKGWLRQKAFGFQALDAPCACRR